MLLREVPHIFALKWYYFEGFCKRVRYFRWVYCTGLMVLFKDTAAVYLSV